MALPVTLYASAVAYIVSILSLTNYRTLQTRVILWTIIAISNAIAVAYAKDFTPEIYYNWWWILLSIHQTLFMAFLYRLDRTQLVIPEQLPYSQRLLHAWVIFWNYRGIGTSWQVRHIPPERILGFKVERPTTRTRFLKIRILNFLIMYFVLCLWYDPLFAPRGWTADDFAVEKDYFFRRLDEVSLREFKIRLYVTINHVLPAWLAFNSTHAGISILAILLGGKPAEWPPFFGSILEAYSVRRYWRVFWHPIIRRSFTSTGSLILVHVCGIDPETQFHRVANTFMVFFLSSLMHFTAEYHWVPLKEGLIILWWWSFQAPMILVEEYVQAYYFKRKSRIEKKLGFRIGHGWERLVGYVWVFLFNFWSTPRLEYSGYRLIFNVPSK